LSVHLAVRWRSNHCPDRSCSVSEGQGRALVHLASPHPTNPNSPAPPPTSKSRSPRPSSWPSRTAITRRSNVHRECWPSCGRSNHFIYHLWRAYRGQTVGAGASAITMPAPAATTFLLACLVSFVAFHRQARPAGAEIDAPADFHCTRRQAIIG